MSGIKFYIKFTEYFIIPTYLIDYKNTKNLLGINDLSSDDYVFIFYSQKASTLSFDAHKEIMSAKANISYICVAVGGQNALDFQLVSYL